MSDFHIPVLTTEAINFLDIKRNNWYIDCNLGGGGHTKRILEKGGKVLGIDIDIDAINYVAKRFNLKLQQDDKLTFAKSDNLIICKSNFNRIDELTNIFHLNNMVVGVLFDLGVSSFQLDKTSKGFSFSKNSELDMRMDSALGVKASDLINSLSERELKELFVRYGEESNSFKIARFIVKKRSENKIIMTKDLADLVSKVNRGNQNINPATKVFQALRIAVNNELENLEEGLEKAIKILTPGGRVVVISFHSLEDRIVKNIFNKDNTTLQVLTKKPITPKNEEIFQNPRSRSAKLRAAAKL